MTSHLSTGHATVAEMRHVTRLGDAQSIIGVLERVGHEPPDPELEGIVLDLLWAASTPALRNAAAIALADMGSSAAKEALVKLIRDPATKGARGTLLYAIEELDASIDLELVVYLLINDNPEVQTEVIRSIEDGRITFQSKQAVRRSIAKLRTTSASETDGHRVAILGKAIDLLESVAA